MRGPFLSVPIIETPRGFEACPARTGNRPANAVRSGKKAPIPPVLHALGFEVVGPDLHIRNCAKWQFITATIKCNFSINPRLSGVNKGART
jgi:hypothetical protein